MDFTYENIDDSNIKGKKLLLILDNTEHELNDSTPHLFHPVCSIDDLNRVGLSNFVIKIVGIYKTFIICKLKYIPKKILHNFIKPVSIILTGKDYPIKVPIAYKELLLICNFPNEIAIIVLSFIQPQYRKRIITNMRITFNEEERKGFWFVDVPFRVYCNPTYSTLVSRFHIGTLSHQLFAFDTEGQEIKKKILLY